MLDNLLKNAGPTHAKRGSVSSVQSAPAAPDGFHDVLLRTLSSSPKGSKMAEDAARAMLMAETERISRKDKGKEKELVPPEPRSGSTTPRPPQPPPVPLTPQMVPSSPSHSIGEMMLGPSSPNAVFEFDEIDELTDLYLQFPTTPSEQPGTCDPAELHRPSPGRPRHPDLGYFDMAPPPGPPPSIPLPMPPHREAHKAHPIGKDPFGNTPLDQNALAIFWRGEAPQMFGLVTYNDPEAGFSAFPVEVMGKATQIVEVPPYWTGRVQKMTGLENDPATHCEFTFDGFAGMTFFRVSYLHGHNGPAMIRTRSKQQQSGSAFRAMNHVPLHLCGHDALGNQVIKPAEQLFRPQRKELEKFYRDFYEGPAQGQADPRNNHALQATHEKQLMCEFY